MCVDLILRIVSLCLYLLLNFFDSCDSGIPGRKTNWTHFRDCIWISKFAGANQLFLVSLHLVLFWKSSVWVALTLLYVASLFLPFCSLLEGLAPPAFASFIPFVGAISLLPACTPSLPCSAVPHSVHADNSHCFSPSCFRLGLFFFLYFFVVQFVVSSWCRWISTSAGWMQTWRGLKLISKINWKAATSKPLDPEAWKVGKFDTTESLFQHLEYQTRKAEM